MTAPLRDIRFLVHDVLDFPGHYARLEPTPGYPPIPAPAAAEIDAVLEAAHRFAGSVLEPIAETGDRSGCVFDGGVVTTPPGFRAAYKTYVEAGWAGLNGNPAHGGQGMPESLGLLFEDCINCANVAWSMYPGLSRGVINALEAHGSPEQQAAFLPRLLTGEWTGTMCLTEPQAGSDVGLVRTRAEQIDGAWRVTGTKIFISAGEHDLADNIVHLVLARLPDAPAGTRGISLFVVPRIDLDGSRNTVTCGGIEQKMGLHGNATCTLHFDGAHGYLIGDANRGMRYMFTMMNAARLVVGLQGCALAQGAFVRAAAHARDRLQLRALSGPVAPDQPADPIIAHPDIRRMLLTQRVIIEGGRALVYYAGQLADLAQRGPEAGRADAAAQLDFLTPIIKGALTELSFESVNLALQIFGGHGYIRDTGVERFVRDARITLIYEGTTQIQALDLLGRKTLQTQGRGLLLFVAEMQRVAGEIRPLLPEMAAALEQLGEEWPKLTLALGGQAMADPDAVGAAAVDYLFYCGYVLLAYAWARMAGTAMQSGQAGASDAWLAGKLAAARFCFARLLPRAAAHRAAMEAGADTLMSMSDAALIEV